MHHNMSPNMSPSAHHFDPDALPLLGRELDLLADWVPLADQRLIELGCGAAQFAQHLLARFPGSTVTGLEVDQVQMDKNRAAPEVAGLSFVEAGAQAIPFGEAQFDGAFMLKSLHHIPMGLMDQALAEVGRVLKPGGWLYVSEPIYGGALNDIIRLFNDEGVVRPAAQAALDRAIARGGWVQTREHRFAQTAQFASFEDFAARMMNASYRNDQINSELLARVAQAYAPHQTAQGAQFMRPMHVRLLRRA